MESNANHVRVEVWGPLAIFTRPEFKTERYSYDCLTPSSARNILQQIYWHPQMQYQITAIKSYNPIQRLALTRNELDTVMSSANALSVLAEVEKTGKAKPLCVPGTDPRQQRSSVFLKDVHYAIEADVLPTKNMPEGHTFDLGKAMAIIERRLKRGQCFSMPYLGIRECLAYFAPARFEHEPLSAFNGLTLDMGTMMFDTDYSNPDDVKPFFFHPIMVDGVIQVPTQKEVMGDAAFCVS